MGSRSDNLCVNIATKYTSYICIHGAAVANLCCYNTCYVLQLAGSSVEVTFLGKLNEKSHLTM